MRGQRLVWGDARFGRGGLIGHVNVFDFRVTFHRSHSEVAANAAAFESAEGRLDVHAGMGIDAQDAAFDAAREAERPLQIIRPKRTAQTVG